jgi:shikimate dehydrogenase
LAEEIANYDVAVTGLALTDDSIKRLAPPDLLVNCTPFGMAGGDLEGDLPPIDALLSPSTLVTDLVYNPSKTPLLRRATELGAQTLGGLPMLIYQGAASFKIWTGKDAPIETMLDIALKGLKQEV